MRIGWSLLAKTCIVMLMALAWQRYAPVFWFRKNSSTAVPLSARLGFSGHSRRAQHAPYPLGLLRSVSANAGQQPGLGNSDGGGDAGNNADAGRPQPAPPLRKQHAGVFQQLFSQLVMAVRLAAAFVLLVAAAPYLLSSRLGTAAAAAAASRMLPGDVQIQRISLGWTQPLSVHGLCIYEGASGSSRELITLQRLSSAESLHQVVSGKGHLTLTLTNPSVDCSLTDSGDNFRLVQYLEESRLLGILTGRHGKPLVPASAPAPVPATVAASAATSTVTAAKVQSHPIDISDDADNKDETAAAVDTSAATVGPQAAAADAASTVAVPAGKTGTAASGTSSSSSSSPQPAEQPAEPATAAAGGGGEGGGVSPSNFIQRLALADASSHVSAELRLPMLSVYIPDGKLLLPRELAVAMGSHIHAVAAAGTSAVEGLAEELDEDMSWLQVQQQHQQHAQEQQQQQQQSEHLQHPGQQQHQPQQQVEQQQQEQEGSQSEEQQGNQAQQHHWWWHRKHQHGNSEAAAGDEPWPLPPLSVSKKSWEHASPVLLQLSGERVSALVRGWHMGSVWRLSKSSLVLEQPATATWEFTPELAALTLSQFNPLLQEVALIREGGQLMTAISPAEGKLPAESGQLWVSPVKLVVGRGNLLSQIYRLLGLHGRFGSSAAKASPRKPWLLPKHSSSTTTEASADAAAKEQAEASAADDGSAVVGIEVWSGPLRVTLEGPGRFRTDRVDMILGSGRNSQLHLALWGTVDTISNSLTMTVGLPASTLSKAGLRGLPPEYMLPVAVSGPLHRPQVEWNAAVRQLAVLSAMQLGREAWQVEGEKVAGAVWGAVTHQEGMPAGLAALLGAANRALSKATSSFIGQVDERLQSELCGVPPPAELPWEHQKHHRHEQEGQPEVSAHHRSRSK